MMATLQRRVTRGDTLRSTMLLPCQRHEPFPGVTLFRLRRGRRSAVSNIPYCVRNIICQEARSRLPKCSPVITASTNREPQLPQRQRSLINGTSPRPSAISFWKSASIAHRQDLQNTCQRKPVVAIDRAVGSSSVIPAGQDHEPSPCVTVFRLWRVNDPDRRHRGRLDGSGTLASRLGDDNTAGQIGRLCGHGGRSQDGLQHHRPPRANRGSTGASAAMAESTTGRWPGGYRVRSSGPP
jgi:hypothetical protein